MNAYQIVTDGQPRLIAANSLLEAIQADYRMYCDENDAPSGQRDTHWWNDTYYGERLLEKTACLGEIHIDSERSKS